MIFNVDFSECTSEIDVDFGEVTEIKSGYTQDEVDKLVADAAAEGVEQGKQAEYDAFWDTYQNNGEPMSYAGMFSGIGWTVDNFKPKYDIIPTNMNEGCFTSGFLIQKDLSEILKSLNIRLDTSQCTGFYRVCYYGTPKRFPEWSFLNATTVTRCFYNATLIETIDKIVMPANEELDIRTMFVSCSGLKNVVFEGKISNDFDMSGSPLLTKDTITSIVNALSESVTGKTVSLAIVAVNTAFETTPGASDGSTSEEWLSLVATRANWTIALA